MKRSSSSNSDSHNHLESPHSPLRFHSPLPSDQGDLEPPDSPFYASPDASPQKSPKNGDEKPNPKAIVAVRDKFTQCSPVPEKKPEPTPAVLMNKAVREEGAPSVTKMGPGEGGERSGAVASILKRSRTGEMMKLANLGFRLSEVVLCLISFSVMAADKTQGWSGDSFDRYREYRLLFFYYLISLPEHVWHLQFTSLPLSTVLLLFYTGVELKQFAPISYGPIQNLWDSDCMCVLNFHLWGFVFLPINFEDLFISTKISNTSLDCHQFP